MPSKQISPTLDYRLNLYVTTEITIFNVNSFSEPDSEFDSYLQGPVLNGVASLPSTTGMPVFVLFLYYYSLFAMVTVTLML